MKYKQNIAIIGEGLAGLTAGLRLTQKGCNVTIYEARERVGGRVFTVLIKGREGKYLNAELGGYNIDDGGEAKNLLALVKELNLSISDDLVKFENSYVFYNNQYYELSSLIAKSFKDIKAINSAINELASTYTSMSDLIDNLIPHNEPLKMCLKTRMTAYEGVDVTRQSVYHNIDTLKEIILELEPNLDHVKQKIFRTIKGGNAILPLKISNILADKIKLNKALKKIYKDGNKIVLNFNDNELLSVDRLILAIPASVYKNVEIDNDLIPKNISEKINRIEYGQNSKILFPVKENSTGGYLITKNLVAGLHNNNATCMLYYTKSSNNSLKELASVAKCFQSWKILIRESKAVPNNGQHYEKFDEPIRYLWDKDYYSQGSYSGYSIDNNIEYDKKIIYQGVEFKKIFAPLNDRVYFIGEHTTLLKEIGTMEAAIESAENLMKLLIHQLDN